MFELSDALSHATLVSRVEVVPPCSLRGARGLLGRDAIDEECGLLLSDPLGCIHTVGMTFAIDIVFLDRSLRVVGIAEDVRPWRLCWRPRGRHQVELAAGSAVRRGFFHGQKVNLRARGGGDGGQAMAQSPRTDFAAGGHAHFSDKSHCGCVAEVPSVPPPAGLAGGDHHHPERRSPCAHTC